MVKNIPIVKIAISAELYIYMKIKLFNFVILSSKYNFIYDRKIVHVHLGKSIIWISGHFVYHNK